MNYLPTNPNPVNLKITKSKINPVLVKYFESKLRTDEQSLHHEARTSYYKKLVYNI